MIKRMANMIPGKIRRITLLILADAMITFLSVFAATMMRFAPNIPKGTINQSVIFLPLIELTYIACFAIFRLYHVLWRYAEAKQIILQVTASLIGGALTLIWNALFECGLSRYMLLMVCALVVVGTCSLRLSARMAREYIARRVNGGASGGRKLLIVGAGNAGSYVVTMCLRDESKLGKAAAIVDDDPAKLGMRIQGVLVAGAIDDVPSIVKNMNISDIIIAMPSVTGERMRQIIVMCKSTHCHVRTLSDPQRVEKDFKLGRMLTREPDIADFLSRGEVKLDDEHVKQMLAGKTVLVTGGGGSIGSEICRQVLGYMPKLLVIFDIYENCAYELEVELKQKYGADCPVKVLIGSVRDRQRLKYVMETYRPNVVFHAAAHKHVPLMEESPFEAVKNNVFGTINVIETANMAGCERYVQISTDKAVNPTNVMGATKRITEMYTQVRSGKIPMQLMAVRFGNVLGSHGSVIPLFVNQIRAGGPVTVTDPEIERYFMTIPEAAQLVMQAGCIGATGSIYVLDMGEPVKILNLAEKLIRFYGLEPNVDIPIKIIGLRPGEKMYEELLMNGEADKMQRTGHDRIMVAPLVEIDEEGFLIALSALRAAVFEQAQEHKPEDIIEMLAQIVPTFRHQTNGADSRKSA